MIADSDPSVRTARRLGTANCHCLQSYAVSWTLEKSRELPLMVYSRLVALFSHVVCVFADDFAGSEELAQMLVSWIKLGSPTDSPTKLRPRVVIVTTEDHASATYTVMEHKNLKFMLNEVDKGDRDAVFSSITVLHMAGDHISQLARHQRLKEVLLTELETSRSNRIEQSMLFTATHLSAFVSRALRHVARTTVQPFNFLICARDGNMVNDDYTKHLTNFFNVGRRCAGGLIVLGLFFKNWDTYECTRIFDILVRDFFGMHLTKGHGLLARLRDHFRSWLSDGCYDVKGLEDALKEKFGEQRRIFEADGQNPCGVKVAVTATTISDAYTYIFSNYNGCGTRNNDYGKAYLCRKARQKGRATSAAPVLFRSAHVQSLGSFQDGGLRHNNPMDLAIWECQKIWPAPAAADVVLSLGTGHELTSTSPKVSQFRHICNDGFIPRLIRTFMSSLDGERTWRDSVNRLDDQRRAKYFRLNVQLDGQEPRLDDVKQIEGLRDSVHMQPDDGKDLERALTALLTASFYFELAMRPMFKTGVYNCRGFVRCRNDPRGILEALARIVPHQLDLTMSGESYVLHLEEVINLSIKCGEGQVRSLSGFPQSVAWFGKQQSLDAPFGTADHDAAQKFMCASCMLALPRPLHGEANGHPYWDVQDLRGNKALTLSIHNLRARL
ncbi:MAG: hypothetical protein Q9217_002665 [Psora testacea]